MHSIKNISERNKIDTQSRADAYIRRVRLIRKSDYNLRLDAPKSILETENNPKNSLFWANIYKKNHWAGFKKKPGFFQPCLTGRPHGQQVGQRAKDDDVSGTDE
jgi:hypothetical protein